MEKNISKNWVFFIEKKPCVDEHSDDGVGFFIFGWCLFGVMWHSLGDSGPQFGIIVLNHAVGFWNDRGEDRI